MLLSHPIPGYASEEDRSPWFPHLHQLRRPSQTAPSFLRNHTSNWPLNISPLHVIRPRCSNQMVDYTFFHFTVIKSCAMSLFLMGSVCRRWVAAVGERGRGRGGVGGRGPRGRTAGKMFDWISQREDRWFHSPHSFLTILRRLVTEEMVVG